MGWEDLVCAACAGRVVEGRCPSCRAARDDFQAPQRSLPAAQLLLLAAALLALLALLAR